MVGAVAGSPGTLPTNWGIVNPLTQTIVGIGTENGIQYMDVRFNGTSAGTTILLNSESSSQIAASNGQTWTNSFYFKSIAAPTPPNSYNLLTIQRLSAIAGGSFVQPFTPTSTLARYTQTVTTNNPSITHIQPYLSIGLTLGATYDFTIRIAAPQMELGATASTFIPTTTAAVTRLTDAFSRSNIYTNGLISAAGGTWFLEFNNNVALTADANSRSLSIGDNAPGTTNAINIINSPIQIRTRISGTVGNTYTTTSSSVVKIAIKWNGTTIDYFVNGVKVLTGGLFAITNMNFLDAAGINTPKFINQSALFPTPLTDAQLVDLTGGRIYYNPVEAYYAYYLTPEIPSAVITSVNSFF
jgi:hypothetical protein